MEVLNAVSFGSSYGDWHLVSVSVWELCAPLAAASGFPSWVPVAQWLRAACCSQGLPRQTAVAERCRSLWFQPTSYAVCK